MGTVLAEGGVFWSEEGGVFWAKNPPLGPKKTLEKIVRFLSAAGKISIVFKRRRQNFDGFYAPMHADTLVLHV